MKICHSAILFHAIKHACCQGHAVYYQWRFLWRVMGRYIVYYIVFLYTYNAICFIVFLVFFSGASMFFLLPIDKISRLIKYNLFFLILAFLSLDSDPYSTSIGPLNIKIFIHGTYFILICVPTNQYDVWNQQVYVLRCFYQYLNIVFSVVL